MTDKLLPCSHMYCCTGTICWRSEGLRLGNLVEELEERISNQRALLQFRDQELAGLRAELARRRPTAPKFHVGQVLGVQHFVVKVASMHFLNYSNMWSYADTCGRGWEESQLRALTDEEK